MLMKEKKKAPALLDKDVHDALMKIKCDEEKGSISAAIRFVLNENELLKLQVIKKDA